jgi:hypothetical protein
MRTHNAITHCVVLGAPFLALVNCGSQRPEQVAQAAPDAKSPRVLAPTRFDYVNVNGARLHYQLYGDLNSGTPPAGVARLVHVDRVNGSAHQTIRGDPTSNCVGCARPWANWRPAWSNHVSADGRRFSWGAGGAQRTSRRRPWLLNGRRHGHHHGLRHPDKVGKQIILSGTSRRDGWYPEINDALAQATPAAFAGSPLEAEYRRLSPAPIFIQPS